LQFVIGVKKKIMSVFRDLRFLIAAGSPEDRFPASDSTGHFTDEQQAGPTDRLRRYIANRIWKYR
jgi:hypothetical protein